MDPKRFVRKIWQALPREPQKAETGKWALGPGVVWLRQPEMWCPYCEVSWVNGWTWLINEKRGRVEAVWGADGQKMYLGGIHPHVMSGGEVCTGGFSVVEAITSGFNILSCFDSGAFVEIMERLGHKGCGQEDRMEEEEDDDRMTCESCYDRFDDDDISFYDAADQYLCDACWLAMSVRCDNCNDQFYYPVSGRIDYPLTQVRGGDEFCENCLEEYSYCEECEEYVHIDDMHPWSAKEDVPTCERCWKTIYKLCDECSEWKLKDEMEDGVCFDCVPEGTGEQIELPPEAGEATDEQTL